MSPQTHDQNCTHGEASPFLVRDSVEKPDAVAVDMPDDEAAPHPSLIAYVHPAVLLVLGGICLAAIAYVTSVWGHVAMSGETGIGNSASRVVLWRPVATILYCATIVGLLALVHLCGIDLSVRRGRSSYCSSVGIDVSIAVTLCVAFHLCVYMGMQAVSQLGLVPTNLAAARSMDAASWKALYFGESSAFCFGLTCVYYWCRSSSRLFTKPSAPPVSV